MVAKIKNWEIPKGKKTVLSFKPINSDMLSVRLRHCLAAMKILQLKDLCIPEAWYVSKFSWTSIILSQPNLGRKAYNELVDYLKYEGLVPIYVGRGFDSDDSISGGLMR